MSLQDFRRFRCDSLDWTSVSFSVLCYEHLCQRYYLVDSFTQGREVEMHRVDPVEKVFTELSFTYHLFKILVSRTNKSYVYRDCLCVSDPCYAAVLEGSEQLCLKMKRNVSDLIQEERTSVSLFEFTDMVCMSICECSLYMAEELALEERFGQCSGVDTDHRSESTLGHAVDFAGQDILSSSVFSGDKDCRICRCDLLHSLAYD